MAEQDLKSPKITCKLQKLAADRGRTDSPGERTVRTYWEKHMARPEEERRAYATFRWPDSMSDAEIPWDSSRIVLDWIKSFEGVNAPRPTICQVKWYWRVYQAGLDSSNCADATLYLAERELDPNEVTIAVGIAVEAYLVHQPWQWAWEESEREIRESKLPTLVRSAGAIGTTRFEDDRPLSLRRFIIGILEERDLLDQGEAIWGDSLNRSLTDGLELLRIPGSSSLRNQAKIHNIVR